MRITILQKDVSSARERYVHPQHVYDFNNETGIFFPLFNV